LRKIGGNMTKILLVEDDKSLREIYGVRLLAEGYDIVSAGDGEEALAMAIKDRPNLIISDVMMPKISGFDMLDILRSTTETKDIRVIMMTALSSEDQRARGESLGADRYLVKSQVGIEDVVRTVHDVLGDAPVSATPSFGSPAPAVGMRPAPITAPAPRPVEPQAPAPAAAPATAPQPAPQPPQAPTPAPAPTFTQAAPESTGLPQPTAPFSTSSRPANLGDRVIHPLERTSEPTNLGSLIDQELGAAQAPVTPTASPFSQAPEQLTQQPTPPPQPPAQTAPAPAPFSAPPAPSPFGPTPTPSTPLQEPPQPPTFQ
jgi:CheY-like chemotaxis protein